MANFTELVKYQKSLGKGNIGALRSSIGQKSLEKLDPRNYLFSKTGLATTLFPFLKGYEAKSPSSKMLKAISPSSQISPEIADKINSIDVNTKITAKNSIVLPALARDMNVMRLNIQKLVRISGETPSRKSDMFFKRASEREELYESQFKKNKGDTKVTPVKKEGDTKKGGIFDFFSNFLSSVLGLLVKGGIIVFLISKLGELIKNLVTDKEFRDQFFKTAKEMGESIFGKDIWENLLWGVSAVAGAFVAFKGTLFLLTKGIEALLSKILGMVIPGAKMPTPSVPGPGAPAPSGPSGKPTPGAPSEKPSAGARVLSGLGKVGPAAFFASLGYDIYRKFFPVEEDDKEAKKTDIGVRAGLAGATLATSGAYAATSIAKGAATTALNLATTPPTGRWGKFLQFVAKKSPTLFAKIGARLATAGAMMAVPGPGWVMTLINLGLSIYSAYELYQLWVEYNNLTTDEQRKIAIQPEQVNSASLTGLETGTDIPPESVPIPSTEPPPTELPKQEVDREMRAMQNRQTDALSRVLAPSAETTRPSPVTTPGGAAVGIYPQQPTPSNQNKIPTDVTDQKGAFKNQKDFLTYMYPLAVKASRELGGVDPNALLTQWGFESSWGTKVSGKYNYFGIKADKGWKGDSATVGTTEFINGKEVKMPDAFRSYNSPEEAVDDYVKFLKTNKRYEKAGVFEAKTSGDYFAALQRAGYATDPEYAKKLTDATAGTAKKVASLGVSSQPIQLASAPSPASTETNRGRAINMTSTQIADARTLQQPIVVAAPPAQSSSQATQPSIQLASATGIVDNDFAELLFRRTAEGAVGA